MPTPNPLAERLRAWEGRVFPRTVDHESAHRMMLEAAARIEALEAAIRLERTLGGCYGDCRKHSHELNEHGIFCKAARTLLEQP